MLGKSDGAKSQLNGAEDQLLGGILSIHVGGMGVQIL